ncbi:pentatricopeptide repeat-containing protein [Tanacetum coccineum]
MYVSCGNLDNARKVFDEKSKQDFNSWAIMIAGYADNGEYEEVIRLVWGDDECGAWGASSWVVDEVGWCGRLASINNCKEERFREVFEVFNEMGKEGVRKNSFTLSSVLSACSKLCDDGNCGEQVHANAIKLGLDSKSYVQCGRNRACWNAMLTSLVQNGCLVEAIKFLYRMRVAGVQPHELRLNKLRSLCGSEEEAYFSLQDLKGSKLSGSSFNIMFNLNKFMAFKSREPFLIRQERENPTMTEWDRFAHRKYIYGFQWRKMQMMLLMVAQTYGMNLLMPTYNFSSD